MRGEPDAHNRTNPTAMCDYYWRSIFSRDLLHENGDGRMSWFDVGSALNNPDEYPMDRDVAQRLVDAFNTLKETDGKKSIAGYAVFPMIDLSRTDVGKEFDIVDTRFIEFFCDSYFTHTHGTARFSSFNSNEVHAFLVSEPYILEEIRGLPRYAEYVDYVLKMASTKNEYVIILKKYRVVYEDLTSVSQSGRLTKRAAADPDS